VERHMTSLHLRKTVHDKLKVQAALENKSITQLIDDLCEMGLKVRAETNKDRLERFLDVARHIA
jgi:predicted DNA-binding ribbon-helix-helix protein